MSTQPLKRNLKTITVKKTSKNKSRAKKNHPKYGTSKLEERFANDFLDKLGVKYIYQFKMESIGRYLDFYLPNNRIAIEVDGDYYHSYGLLYENMSPMQKKNHRVDKQKDHWAAINGIKMIRIWEHDINNNPTKVMELLKDELVEGKVKKIIDDKKKLRHNVNKYKNTGNRHDK